MTIERRFFPGATVELREEGEGKTHITGYGARFNEPSPIYSSFGGFQYRETIDPGFFDDVLGDDVRGLWNHNPDFVLGRTKAGTMKVSKDASGVSYDIEAPATQSVRDFVIGPIRRRDVTGSSFGFEFKNEETDGEPGDKWVKAPDGVWDRTLLKARRLYDFSPVTYPFFETASTQVDQRSMECAQRSLEAFQKRTESAGDPQLEALQQVADNLDQALRATDEPCKCSHSRADHPDDGACTAEGCDCTGYMAGEAEGKSLWVPAPRRVAELKRLLVARAGL